MRKIIGLSNTYGKPWLKMQMLFSLCYSVSSASHKAQQSMKYPFHTVAPSTPATPIHLSPLPAPLHSYADTIT